MRLLVDILLINCYKIFIFYYYILKNMEIVVSANLSIWFGLVQITNPVRMHQFR